MQYSVWNHVPEAKKIGSSGADPGITERGGGGIINTTVYIA